MLCVAAVAPLVGAWIEIPVHVSGVSTLLSLLSWERGLKSDLLCDVLSLIDRRSSRGSVD